MMRRWMLSGAAAGLDGEGWSGRVVLRPGFFFSEPRHQVHILPKQQQQRHTATAMAARIIVAPMDMPTVRLRSSSPDKVELGSSI